GGLPLEDGPRLQALVQARAHPRGVLGEQVERHTFTVHEDRPEVRLGDGDDRRPGHVLAPGGVVRRRRLLLRSRRLRGLRGLRGLLTSAARGQLADRDHTPDDPGPYPSSSPDCSLPAARPHDRATSFYVPGTGRDWARRCRSRAGAGAGARAGVTKPLRRAGSTRCAAALTPP